MERARLLLGTTLVFLVAASTGALWTAIVGPRANLPVIVLLFAATLGVPWLLKRTRSLFVSTNALNAIIYAGLIGLIVNTSGQTLPPFMLLPALPLIASMIAGGRSGLFWALMSCAGLGLAYVVSPEVGGSSDSPQLLDPQLITRGKFFGSFQMLAIVTATSMAEWRLRRDSLNALVDAKHLAEERYRQLLEQQARLEEARSGEADLRDRFFSHISHELRTPLTPLHQFLTLVLDEVSGPISAEQREYLQVALRNAEQMNKLIGDLTDAARLQSGRLEMERAVVELGPLTKSVLRSFESQAAEKSVRFSIWGEPDRLACCDARRVARILQSLLENAVRFAPEGSTIEIGIEGDPEDPESLRISVSDAGPGIDPESRERIFQSLAQEHVDEWVSRQGLGLGLFIASALVKRLNGRLWVESEKGNGATFFFTLPRYDLKDLVKSVVSTEGRRVDQMGLLVLRIHSDVSEDRMRTHRAVGQELGVVLFPHVDVVLPFGAPGVPVDCHVAITRTDQETLPRLVDRMSGHFHRFTAVEESDTRIAVEGILVRLDNDGGPEASIERATARVEDVIRGLAGADEVDPSPTSNAA